MKNITQAQKNQKGKAPAISEKIECTMRDERGCIHERFAIIRELAANGGVMGTISQGRNSTNPANDDIFNEDLYHSDSIDQFITIFARLPEVKDSIITGNDDYGVVDALSFYYKRIAANAKKTFPQFSEEEQAMLMDEVENYICKRLYPPPLKVFPEVQTKLDFEFYQKCKLFDWINYDHLEILARNRCCEMWDYAANILNSMDNRMTPYEKLECMVECFKIITQVIDLAASKDGGGGADDTLPIMIYVILKACPKRMHSNLNFITMLREKDKMLAGEGYCYTQVKSAVLTIESINHKFLRMPQEQFQEIMKKKEIEHQAVLRR